MILPTQWVMPDVEPRGVGAPVGRADEQLWRGTIGEAVAAVQAFPLSAPTIFAVGDALASRQYAVRALAASN